MTEMLIRPVPGGLSTEFDEVPIAALPGQIRDESFDEALTCCQVIEVTHDVKTFVLAREASRPTRFQAGQHLTVTVDIDGERYQRCYSISSAPTDPGPLSITVKRVPGGPVSGWLHDHLVPGGLLWATGPYGDFTRERYPAAGYLFLSAGSGITPLMSMTRTLRDTGADVAFVHSARTPDDIIFRSELEAMAARGAIHLTAFCEADSPGEHWDGPTGRLGLRGLLGVPDLHDREIFVCGPQGYMAAVRDLLDLAGVDPKRCHEESYDLQARADALAAADEDGAPLGPTYAVEFQRTGRQVECGENETLLHAAHRAGLNPPSMCTEGMCGTCKLALVCGRVDMHHAGGIRQAEIDDGQILICCSKPRTDVVLDA